MIVSNLQALVIQKVDNAIHWINLCPVDNAVGIHNTNEGGPITNNNIPTGCGRGNATLIVFIEEHFIQSSIQSSYSINVLSGDLYQGTLICIDLST